MHGGEQQQDAPRMLGAAVGDVEPRGLSLEKTRRRRLSYLMARTKAHGLHSG